ncbi:hypothetical protein FB566_2713 [Stackebrandtia endophytica]|uniref:Uncharacterized protein n=1 Tax=Stackebrandtia endophytica TaxID=1496996 RepID=A0A543AX79_9ACTN|nr:hypothetical protein [Stackebrandtia endophytica]TQL77163.1 hypothetical protein FB566_2713 [Stackebrandtia endophytica]
MTYPNNPHQPGYGPHNEPATSYSGPPQPTEPNTYAGPTGSFTPPPQNSSASRVILIIALCVALVFGVGATITAISLFSGEEEPSTDTAGDGEDPSESSSPPLEEEEPAAEGPTSPVAVTYTTPSGFSVNINTTLVTPLYDEYTVDILTMDGVDTYESVFVTSYLLPFDTTDYSDDQKVTTIDSLDTVLGKLNSDEPGMASVAGRDAVVDYIEQAGTTQDVISYDSYFFFDGWYLVQVGCQPDEKTSEVETACQSILETVSW